MKPATHIKETGTRVAVTRDQLAIQQRESQLLLQHKGLLHRFSKRGYARLQAMRVVMDYEDVFQFMCMSMIKARDKFDPSRGFTFTAYFGRACLNDFQKWAEKLIGEQVGVQRNREGEWQRVGLGLVRDYDMEHAGLEDDEGDDFINTLPAEPEDYEEERTVKREFAQHWSRLSPDAKKVLMGIMNPSDELRAYYAQQMKEVEADREAGLRSTMRCDYTLNMVARFYGMGPRRIPEIKRELSKEFNVKLI